MSNNNNNNTQGAGKDNNSSANNNTGNTQTNGSGNNNRNNNQDRNRNNRNYGNSNSYFNAIKPFEEAEQKIRVVLGLRSERFDKKVPFEIYKDKLIKYMGCEMIMSEYIECLVKNREDPKKCLIKIHAKAIIIRR